MNIYNIELTNFLSYKKATLKLSSNNPYLFVGEIGSGKSALVRDSITYALSGNARASGAGDDLITNGQNKMSVGIEFILNNKKYGVERKRERNKKTTLRLVNITDKGIMDGNTLTETQKRIDKLLGMDYEMFMASACFEQGKYDTFSSLTPKQAKQLLINMLQLSIYEQYKKKAKEVRDKIDNKINGLESKIEASEMITVEKRERIDLGELATHKKVIEETIKIEEAQKRKVDQKRNKLYSNKSALNSTINQLSKNVERIGNKIDKLKATKGKCPLCLTELTEEKINKVEASLLSDIEGYQKEVDKLKVEALGINKNLKETTFDSTRLNKLKSKLMLISEAIGKEKSAQKEWERLLIIKEEGVKARVKKKKYLKLKERVEKLIIAFGDKGIPSYIIENTLPEVENIANEIILNLSDGKIKIEFDTVRKLKSGEKTETLDIVISDEKGTRPYHMYSGGEKFLIDFALRVALSVLLSRRSGIQIKTLIIDEGFGSLDGANKEKLAELIQYISCNFGFEKILIITHSEEVIENFDNVIRIKKGSQGSYIELVN